MPQYNPRNVTDHGFVLHIMIIWSKAMKHKDYIITDLDKNFDIVKVFRCQWNESLFIDNYMTFYAHSQYQRNIKEYTEILEHKIDSCGKGEFILIVFKDYTPIFEPRETSSGTRVVNRKVFDKKNEYRQLVGGGHRIHGSDDAWETNKDLTILLGLNTEDFLSRYCSCSSQNYSKEVIPYNNNCVGVDGYNSIEELFYVLNNTIDYVVLRNHEVLPQAYTVEGHGDIDLLVENKNYAVYLTLAKPVFTEPYRVYYNIKIAGKEVPFDFRHVGDGYYDETWERNILKNRVLERQIFYVPSPIDQFYSLLYHAYVQKPFVKDDYPPKLHFYANNIGLLYEKSQDGAMKLLDSFLSNNCYAFTRPNDLTVFINFNNLKLSSLFLKFGFLIKTLFQENDNGMSYISKVFEKNNSFIKVGTPWLIENEYVFLKRLENYEYFPKVIAYKKEKLESILEISRVDGETINKFFIWRHRLHASYVKSFINEICKIINIFRKEHIIHRDFIPQNFLISESGNGVHVNVIDFGWAINDFDIESCRIPRYLGDRFRPKNGYSDSYTFGQCLLDRYNDKWYALPYARKCAMRLISGSTDVTDIKITVLDEYKLFLYRHQKVLRIHKSFTYFIRTCYYKFVRK